MRKPYILLALLAAITPAHAALVIEPEPMPAYIPYPPVAPVAAPAPYSAAPAAPVPAQGTAPQQFQPTAAPQANPPAAAQPLAASQAASDGDQARRLLAEDAAKIINPPAAKTASAADNKPLVSTEVKSAPSMNTVEAKPEAAAPKADAASSGLPEIKSEVVEVKPTVETEPLPSWQAASGTTLRQTIEGWSSTEGWGVRWESDMLDYPIEQPFSMVGKYLDVVTRTFELYKDAKRPFKVEVYPSQKLVVVKEKK